MKTNRVFALIVIMSAAMLLSGCGSFPELTDDEYREVVNYAAGLIVRYQKGTSDKLANLSPDYTPEGMEVASIDTPEQEEVPEAESAAPEQPAPVPEPVEGNPPDISGNDMASLPVEGQDIAGGDTGVDTAAEGDNAGEGDVPVQDQGSRTYEAAGEPAVDTPLTPIDQSWLQGLADGIRVEYTGYSVRTAYPDADAQGAVFAGNGERLLVLDFRLRNVSGADATINTARYGPAYKLVINGYVQGFTLVTMIDNDLSSMVETLAPDEKRDVVLVMHLPADVAKTVDRLDLRILQGSEMQTVNLE